MKSFFDERGHVHRNLAKDKKETWKSGRIEIWLLGNPTLFLDQIKIFQTCSIFIILMHYDINCHQAHMTKWDIWKVIYGFNALSFFTKPINRWIKYWRLPIWLISDFIPKIYEKSKILEKFFWWGCLESKNVLEKKVSRK